MKRLEVQDLVVETVDGVRVVDGASMIFEDGKRYALVGRNGAGKSSLLLTIMGHPGYKVVAGDVLLDGKSIVKLSADERAKAGLFLGMQYPCEVAGVSFANFLRTAVARVSQNSRNFLEVLGELKEEALALGFVDFDADRDLNAGFSGGEKKKSEVLQMLMLRPRFGFLDEPDSGLDKKSVELVAKRLAKIDYPTCLVIVSHHDRLLGALEIDETYTL